jgi:phosphoglucomutase
MYIYMQGKMPVADHLHCTIREEFVMDHTKIKKEYERWCAFAVADADVKAELKEMEDASDKMEDAFYRDLEFGTGGLRGVIGAGTNRMNIYTVAKASQGLADYVRKHFAEAERSIAVSYDSRIKSDVFARVSAAVFAANGIHVYIYDELMPTPCLSFAVRELTCAAGIMVTASHNPSKYNGYKVYGADGCQITTAAAAEILAEIEKIDIFADIQQVEFEHAMAAGDIEYIPQAVITKFVDAVKAQSVLAAGEQVDKNVAIVYSPLNGTGLKPVLRTLKESGFTNITVVKEQEQPDGHFPTCPYPNPEIREAMELGIEYAKKYDADLLLATDPDCDRVGIAVKNEKGEHVLLSGNETGMLLLDYICSRRMANGTMPENPVMIKTIVTIDMAERIAAHYGVKTINVLTGFKFIGEQIGLLEAKGCEDSYIFGFEESYGYLSGSYVRDKDAVDGAFLICEMFAYYKSQGIGLWEKLQELYAEYGYCLNTLHSYTFEGAAGFTKMQEIMTSLRGPVKGFGGKPVETCLDYSEGLDGLPKSNVLKFLLQDHCSVVIRPSGTEPKMKAYISVSAENADEAGLLEKAIVADLAGYFA